MGKLLLQLRGIALKQGELHQGKFLPEPGQYVRQQRQPAGVGDAQPQHPHIMSVYVAYFGQKLTVQIQNLGGGIHQHVPRVGEGQLRRTGKELHVQLPLQIADVVGQGLLRDIQPLGGTGDVQLLRHQEKVFQMQEIHMGTSFFFR